jgi:hypothetical protein
MKKTQFARLIALSAISLVVGHAAYSQPALSGAPAVKPAAADTEDSPPSYMLVIAGLSAVVFIGARRRSKI